MFGVNLKKAKGLEVLGRIYRAPKRTDEFSVVGREPFFSFGNKVGAVSRGGIFSVAFAQSSIHPSPILLSSF